MSQNFSKGKIYKITNDFNDDVYVGSTCDTLIKRFSAHKYSMRDNTKNSSKFYTFMNEIGFERFRIDLIEDYSCTDKYQLRQREGHYLRQIGTLNKEIAGRNVQEWYLENKDQKKMYREQNKEHIKDTQHQNYEKRKLKLLETMKCECGCVITKNSLLRHLNTKKHSKLIGSEIENAIQTV
jgi:primosomal protein N''